uniref:CD79b molecule n=1 Tax=Labrus bergylta TaxID=56723 RepID=A0A3Q3H1D4_9LABR|nr:B-cell antigen receptor complex-associated protein beta chain [Labrus bergylta]
MFWLLLLAGYCGLALVNNSVAQKPALQIIQKPRYYGAITGFPLSIQCLVTGSVKYQWYWAAQHNASNKEPLPGRRENIQTVENTLHILNLRLEDSGVYFCKANDTWGPGTGVKVARNITVTQVQYRTKLKDGLMIFQGLLLAVCIAALLLRKQDLLENTDSIYEEPETDHIYEGLAIETCGGGLYEELSVYAQVDGAEAPWE